MTGIKRAALFFLWILAISVFIVMPAIDIADHAPGGSRPFLWYCAGVAVALGLRITVLLRDHRAGQPVRHHLFWIVVCFFGVSVNGVYIPIVQVAIIGYTVGQLSIAVGRRSSSNGRRVAR